MLPIQLLLLNSTEKLEENDLKKVDTVSCSKWYSYYTLKNVYRFIGLERVLASVKNMNTLRAKRR